MNPIDKNFIEITNDILINKKNILEMIKYNRKIIEGIN